MPLTFTELIQRLASDHRLDLRGYKYTTLQRRTRRRMGQLRIADYDTYLERLEQTPDEAQELLNTVLINVTKFYRDPLAWDFMRKEVMPLLLAHKRPGESFRVWCAGCSTGEEPYTVAMMVADHLGTGLKNPEIKIYASDQDEHALAIARKGVYPSSALDPLPAEWRERYFARSDKAAVKIDLELRRMVIFGRSDIAVDAPISHVHLLVCRNLLIYFDAAAQRHILNRLQYAIEPEGVLFLGKSESQLRTSPYFVPLNTRWRIFQRTAVPSLLQRPRLMTPNLHDTELLQERAQQELSTLRVYHNAILETIDPGVLVLDRHDTVVNENAAVQQFWTIDGKMTGSRLSESSLGLKCPDLVQRLEETRLDKPRTVEFQCSAPDEKQLRVTLRPVMNSASGDRLGTIIYMQDVTPQEALQSTIEELQATAEELQSSNEELETTNEELQSTNEELETTNEELQSTNEELETTNEELKSLNEELEDINDELNNRSRELDELKMRYAALVEGLPQPALLVSDGNHIQFYNSAAKKLFGFAAPSVQGMGLEELPLPNAQRLQLIQQYEGARRGNHGSLQQPIELQTSMGTVSLNVRVQPLSVNGKTDGMLLLFEPSNGALKKVGAKKSTSSKRTTARSSSKKKSKSR